MAEPDPRPYLVVTVLLDPSARAAALTRSHGDNVERAYKAAAGQKIAGIELAELAIAPLAFSALRKRLGLRSDVVALYDVFPLPAKLAPSIRRAAAQFLAAEGLWVLEGQGMFDGVPPNEKLELPPGWGKSPQEVRDKLVEAGALELSPEGAEAYRTVKARWDQSLAAPPSQLRE